ncbi:sure-like protein [Lactarius tabidus]
MASKRLTVLLTNDDGPPSYDSPYTFGLYKHLTMTLGWDVRVVIPSSQKSWIGKAYLINDIIRGRFYYPRDPDGSGETSDSSRALKEGEIGEWILIDGTPASCANIALHNLYPGEIDLVVSGPNLGRNTSAAFALSSGTLGAALSSSLSQFRSIALSYGTMDRYPSQTLFDPAHTLSAKIIQYLWDNWGKDEGGLRSGEVDLYSINIPMIPALLGENNLPIIWTRLWRNTYQSLFEAYSPKQAAKLEHSDSQAGPDSIAQATTQAQGDNPATGNLSFRFSPDLSSLIGLQPSTLPEGCDSWAIEKGWVSVSPLRASFGEPHEFAAGGSIQDRIWKIKL